MSIRIAGKSADRTIRWAVALLCAASLLAGMAAAAAATPAAPSDTAGMPVAFPSLADARGRGDVRLSGDLFQPEGSGPFPAVVLLHGCRGINQSRDLDWVRRLLAWGYVVLQVDSYGPRGVRSACTNLEVPGPETRGRDVYGATRFLHTLPLVDPGRIAALGWDQGAWTLRYVLQPAYADLKYLGWERYRLRAGVWFYARRCRSQAYRFNAPLLLLVGGKGDRNAARVLRCRDMVERSRAAGSQIELVVYWEAYQAFDWRGKDEQFDGSETPYRLLYDPQAEADAIQRVKEFLAEQLRQNTSR